MGRTQLRGRGRVEGFVLQLNYKWVAYVAVSRGAYDAQIFTNDREKLGAALGHDVSHSSAHAPEMKPEQKQSRQSRRSGRSRRSRSKDRASILALDSSQKVEA